MVFTQNFAVLRIIVKLLSNDFGLSNNFSDLIIHKFNRVLCVCWLSCKCLIVLNLFKSHPELDKGKSVIVRVVFKSIQELLRADAFDLRSEFFGCSFDVNVGILILLNTSMCEVHHLVFNSGDAKLAVQSVLEFIDGEVVHCAEAI